MDQTSSAGPRVWWLLPHAHAPSRGVDMVLEVAMLAQELEIGGGLIYEGTERPPISPAFRDVDLPQIQSLTQLVTRGEVASGDVLFYNFAPEHPVWPGRSWMFVQGASSLIQALIAHRDLHAAGIEGAWAVMPHLVQLINKWSPLPHGVHLVPPFVQPLKDQASGLKPWGERRKRCVLFPKAMYTALGQLDHTFLTKMLTRRAAEHGWEIVQLEGLSPIEVQELFSDARLFINTNTLESLNATLIEAMAAGCPVISYTAIGGVDFLEDGVNAQVFENLEVFQALEAALDIIEHTEVHVSKMEGFQKAGWATASQYNRQRTREAMAEWWHKINSPQ